MRSLNEVYEESLCIHVYGSSTDLIVIYKDDLYDIKDESELCGNDKYIEMTDFNDFYIDEYKKESGSAIYLNENSLLENFINY